MSKQAIYRALFLLAILALAGCSPLIKPEQPVQSGLLPLRPGQTIGQTFVAHYDGLEGVALFLDPGSQTEGSLRLRLYQDPASVQELGESQVPLQNLGRAGFHRFSFPRQVSSKGATYYLTLELAGNDTGIQAGIGPADSYLHGAAYVQDQPQEAQLSFRLVYSSQAAWLGLSTEALGWLAVLALTGLLFLLPGWVLLSVAWPGWRAFIPGDRIGLAAGASLALYPLLLLWTDLANLHLGPLYAWLPLGVSFALLVWRFFRKRGQVSEEVERTPPVTGSPDKRQTWWQAIHPADLALLAVAGLTFATRMWAIRDLVMPMWGDSVQHTTITQLLLDQKGLFTSWEPYAPYRSLTVQFGFPALAAIWSWVSGVSSPTATLLVGQVINWLAALTLYPLATRLARGNRWAGVGAVLVAGLLSPMPAFYVNWGRYAQLAGLAILPAALWALWATVDALPSNWRQTLRRACLAGYLLAGMTLAYYRMPFYYASFAVVLLFLAVLPRWKLNIRQWGTIALTMSIIAATGLILFLPWVPRLLNSQLGSFVEAGINTVTALDTVIADFAVWKNLQTFAPLSLLLVGSLGAILALFQRQWMVAGLAIWFGLLSAYVAGQMVGLPAANMLQNFAIVISLYIPLALSIGWLLGQGANVVGKSGRQAGQGAMALGILALTAWGGWEYHTVAQPASFAMVTEPDLAAMDWIKKNTPSDANFLIQSFSIYGGWSAVGADAGWWIPLLAGRRTNMPPQYALMTEQPEPKEFSQQVIALINFWEAHSINSPDGLDALCRFGITHIYNGQLQGKVGDGVRQLFSDQELETSPAFERVYHRDRVSIYALKPSTCSQSLQSSLEVP